MVQNMEQNRGRDKSGKDDGNKNTFSFYFFLNPEIFLVQVMVLGMKEGVGLAHCQGSTNNGGQKNATGDWADESSGDISVSEDGEDSQSHPLEYSPYSMSNQVLHLITHSGKESGFRSQNSYCSYYKSYIFGFQFAYL